MNASSFNGRSAEELLKALECSNPSCPCHASALRGRGKTHCPAHPDAHPSLDVTDRDGLCLFICRAGCTQQAVIQGFRNLGIWTTPQYGPNRSTDHQVFSNARRVKRYSKVNETVNPSVKAVTPLQSSEGITLEKLAEAKGFTPDFLKKIGCQNYHRLNAPTVRIPYLNTDGQQTAIRYRLRLNKEDGQRFAWRKGDSPTLYGLERLETIKEAGWVLVVEGESDCWTAWLHNVPALGLPGKGNWKPEWADLFEGLNIYVWVEPDASELIGKLSPVLPGLRVIPAPDEIKDLNEAHLRGLPIPAFLEGLKAQARRATELLSEQQNETVKELRQKAAPVLDSPDPLELVKKAIERLGYGGDRRPPLIVYLAATSRLLEMRQGQMPVHLLLCGQASAGKSYALRTCLRLLPPEAYQVIEAGSPRALIYNDASFVHRLLVFGEADSLPAGEDNPAASAVRNLLQDHCLKYEVAIKGENGDYVVRKIEKEGPTVLITTATKRLGYQLDTRLFTLEMPDDQNQIRDALMTQARLELSGNKEEPDESLLAYQSLLQALVPWDVTVPFAEGLAKAIGKSPLASRITRDFARLISLIKVVALIRHPLRSRDEKGRIVATLEDYRVIYDLVWEVYRTSSSGASEGVREAVRAVSELMEEGVKPISVTAVGNRLKGGYKMKASRHVNAALKGDWLINEEARKGYAYDLRVGEPLPEDEGLPKPEDLGV